MSNKEEGTQWDELETTTVSTKKNGTGTPRTSVGDSKKDAISKAKRGSKRQILVKLSAKAQALLDETLKLVEPNKAQRDERVNDRVQEVQSTSQQAFDGYEEENCDIGSIQTIDTDIVEDERRPNLLVRTRRAAEIIMTSEPIERNPRPQIAHVSDNEEETRVSDHHVDEPSGTSSQVVSSEAANAEREEETDAHHDGNNEGASESSSAKPATTPIPHETELSRPRRATKAKTLPKRTLRGKGPSVNLKAANVGKRAPAASSNNDTAADSTVVEKVPTPSSSKEPTAELTVEEPSTSESKTGRKRRSVGSEEKSKVVPASTEEQEQDPQGPSDDLKESDDAATASDNVTLEKDPSEASSNTKKSKTGTQKAEEVVLKRPPAIKPKRGRGRPRTAAR
ncbi:hypothetical protein OESDEN_11658 [Oesophagostomum dentatum]|uniref:Uncharacterized protein n=1 Tax=Oesophagostomum dentatum TaxID=61180 RepID=A0A0B1STB0_OESDE|nr:hypothetical protein OESDEN_11658 [Oesophagostomum dentatum]